MLNFDTQSPVNINKARKVKVNIESPQGDFNAEAINVFGGIISNYNKTDPGVIVTPFGFGEITPGMLFSHIASLVACALAIAIETEIPIDILKTVALKAVDEGLSGNYIIHAGD
jgi:hypothetical protein